MDSKSIYEAINKVMQEVGYVQKTGKVTGRVSYKFAGEADLIQALRPAMVQHGIVMSVKRIADMQRSEYTTGSGTVMHLTIITGEVEFAHAPSNTTILTMAVGEGADSGDKSVPKAMTGMYKYALRQTFCIETGDDPDQTPSETQERQASGNGHKPAQAPAKAQAPKQTAPDVEADTGLRLTPDKLKAAIIKKAASYEGRTCTKPQRGLMAGMLQECFAGDESKRKEFSNWLTGYASSSDIPDAYVLSLIDWLKPEKDSGGAFQPDDMAVREANSALTVALIDAGQMSFD